MPLVVKTKTLAKLFEWGCNPALVDALNKHGVQLTIVDGAVRLKFHDIVVNHFLEWHHKTPNLSAVDLDTFLMTVLGEINTYVGNKVLPKSGWMGEIPPQETQVTASGVIPLREAKGMYQKVYGTSNGSVYVVVAISKQAKVKIAARVGPTFLSVRVEGDNGNTIGPSVIEALKKQALTEKYNSVLGFRYLSGHFSCTPEAPANKILGAVLMGSGLLFDTPFPDMAKVNELSA